MCALVSSAASCEQRSVIRFLHAENVVPAEISRRLKVVYGNKGMSYKSVRSWCKMFDEGRTNVHDEERAGRPSVISEEIVDKVREAVLSDRRSTITELCEKFPSVSRGTMFEIVRNCLGFRKLCARWVPKQLTDFHQETRMAASLKFLMRYNEEGNDFLDRIITCDETWVHHINPETKRASMQWKHTESPRVRKFKQVLSANKMLACVFWDSRGILLVDFIPSGSTVNSEVYCNQLKKLRRAVQNKRRGLLTAGVVFLQDNARPHTSRVTKELLQSFKWDVLDHPPHSLDLAPSDFHLFPALKGYLGGKRFQNNEELQECVMDWFNNLAAPFYEEGIKKLIHRWDKCLNRGGDYVEK